MNDDKEEADKLRELLTPIGPMPITNIEKTLELTLKGNVYDKNTKLYLNDDKFLITSNQKVTWSVNKYYEPTEKFNSEINTTETSCEVEHNFNTYPKITAKTKAGQIIELDVFFVVN